MQLAKRYSFVNANFRFKRHYAGITKMVSTGCVPISEIQYALHHKLATTNTLYQAKYNNAHALQYQAVKYNPENYNNLDLENGNGRDNSDLIAVPEIIKATEKKIVNMYCQNNGQNKEEAN